MKFRLPYPPSVNNYLRFTSKGHAYLTADAKRYKQSAKLRALTQDVRPITHGEVVVTLTVFRPAKRGDLDNILKVLLDALNGVAYTDDKQIAELHVARFEDAADPRVEIHIAER